MWEWRAFACSGAAELERAGQLIASASGSTEERADTYVIAERLGAVCGLKLRGGRTLELKLLGRTLEPRQLELWSKPFSESLEVPPYRTRELARLLAPDAPVPVRPLRSPDDVLRLVRDLRLGEPRAVTLEKHIQSAVLDGVRLERTRYRMEELGGETVSVDGADPDAVFELVRRFGGAPLRGSVASYPAMLAATLLNLP